MSPTVLPLEGLLDFIRLLRLAGMRVGLTETQDALKALMLFPDWTHARAVLRAVLLKRRADVDVFERVFELCFRRPPQPTPQAQAHTSAAEGAGGGGQSPGGTSARSYERALDGAVQFMLRHVFVPAGGGQARGQQARSVQEALVLLTQMVQPQAPEGRSSQEVRRDLELAFVAALQAREPRAEHLQTALEALLAPASLGEVDFGHMDEGEAQLIEEQIERWVRQLLARPRRRMQPARRGQLEMRRTARRCLQYGGVPLQLVRRKRRALEPRLFVLADVSQSVQTFARFFLMLTRAFQVVVGPCRSFAFSDGLYEITEPLQAELDRRAQPAEGVDRLLARLRAAGVTQRHTDYGTTLLQFCSSVRNLNRRSTVVILGDARSNRAPPQAQALGRVHDRARQVIWLNPERRALWNTGDSIMDAYEPYCSQACECRNLAQLRAVVLALAKVLD